MILNICFSHFAVDILQSHVASDCNTSSHLLHVPFLKQFRAFSLGSHETKFSPELWCLEVFWSQFFDTPSTATAQVPWRRVSQKSPWAFGWICWNFHRDGPATYTGLGGVVSEGIVGDSLGDSLPTRQQKGNRTAWRKLGLQPLIRTEVQAMMRQWWQLIFKQCPSGLLNRLRRSKKKRAF